MWYCYQNDGNKTRRNNILNAIEKEEKWYFCNNIENARFQWMNKNSFCMTTEKMERETNISYV